MPKVDRTLLQRTMSGVRPRRVPAPAFRAMRATAAAAAAILLAAMSTTGSAASLGEAALPAAGPPLAAEAFPGSDGSLPAVPAPDARQASVGRRGSVVQVADPVVTPGPGNAAVQALAAIGARSAVQLGPAVPASALTASGIPDASLRAYVRAALRMRTSDPSCGLDWSLLAAIGRVESNHGRFAGAVVGSDGRSRPSIIGIRLDGSNNTAVIRDSDGGSLDGDTVYDRAVGPMQFIPSSWNAVAVDGDGNGVTDPQDIDDAATAAAVYLCAGSGNLGTLAGARGAVFRYNHSADYVNLVVGLAGAYASGRPVATLPTPHLPPVSLPVLTDPPSRAAPNLPRPRPAGVPQPRPAATPSTPPAPATSTGTPTPTSSQTSTWTPSPSGTTTHPSPTPTGTSTGSVTPTPTPTPTSTGTGTGTDCPSASPSPSTTGSTTTPTPTGTPTATPSPTGSPTPTECPTGTPTPTPSCPTPTGTGTGSGSPTPSPTGGNTSTPTPTSTPTAPAPTPTPTC